MAASKNILSTRNILIAGAIIGVAIYLHKKSKDKKIANAAQAVPATSPSATAANIAMAEIGVPTDPATELAKNKCEKKFSGAKLSPEAKTKAIATCVSNELNKHPHVQARPMKVV
jgi:hypothetical protein